MRNQHCPCEDCEAAWLEWAEQLHDADLMAARDCITLAAWRDEFDAWLERQEGGTP